MQPVPEPPPTGSVGQSPAQLTADRVLSGEHSIDGGFTVPEGETWAFDPTRTTSVTVDANVVVLGRLEMKPASADVVHTLRFVGIDETAFRGGHTMHPVASDIGLWVLHNGQLDLQGTPRAGWNRTGVDQNWRPGDEVRAAPQDQGQYEEFDPFTPGSAVPSVVAPDGSVHHTEVFNLTRNVRVLGGGENVAEPLAEDGRAHVVFLHCARPQTITYAEFRWMGPRRSDPDDGNNGVTSRYPLHFHHCHDGSRGSVIRGVVVRDSGNRAFVPHASHGIAFRDTIAFDVFEAAYWWDPGAENASNDVLYEHAAAFLIRDFPSFRGYGLKGFELGSGTGNVIRDSVAVGVLGRKQNAGGFMWPSHANHSNNVWTFEGNVAHNNKGAGIGVWQNDNSPHVVEDFVSYRNGEGISHGAYVNSYTYRSGLSFDEDVRQFAIGGSLFENIVVGGNLVIREHAKGSQAPSTWRNLDLRGSVIVNEEGEGGVFRFESTDPRFDLTREDFDVRSRTSRIEVINSDGARFTVQ